MNSDRLLSFSVALLPSFAATGCLVWKMGGLGSWPAPILPLSLFIFLFFWSFWLAKRTNRFWSLAVGTLLGLVLAHVMIWLPFLLGSYGLAHGPSRYDYAVLAGIFTAVTVGWYIMTEHLWQSALLAFGTFLALGVGVSLRKRRGDLG